MYELSDNSGRLRLIYYITASLATHLLLIGFLYLIPTFTDAEPSVFNVDLVAPPEIRKPPEPVPASPESRITRPPFVTRRPTPAEKELPPETLYGRGTGDVKKETGKNLRDTRPEAVAKAPPSGSGNDTSPEKETGTEPPGETGEESAPLSYLFDKKTIEKFARKDSLPQKGLTFDTSDIRHRGYMRMLKERIESIWQYPREAARMGLSGDLYMKFTIKRDGRLGEIELLRTSGFRDLDEAAIKAVEKAGPFWPLPEDWEGDDLEIKGHFIYVLGDVLVL